MNKNGEPEGFGREEWQESFLYEGIQLDNKCNGYGRFIFMNGKYYEGFLKDNKHHGYGKLVYPTGIIMEGLWIDDDLQEETSSPRSQSLQISS